MSEQKKTEDQIRHDIRRKFNFSETNDTERIDTAVGMEKDRFKAVEKKLELKKQLDNPDKPAGEKKDPVGQTQGSEPKYTLKDTKALIDVHDDDVDEITDYAKYKGISIAEAKKTGHIKTYLSEQKEVRKTSDATNTGGGKRGTSKISGDNALDKMRSNKELTDEEMNAALDKKFSPGT